MSNLKQNTNAAGPGDFRLVALSVMRRADRTWRVVASCRYNGLTRTTSQSASDVEKRDALIVSLGKLETWEELGALS